MSKTRRASSEANKLVRMSFTLETENADWVRTEAARRDASTSAFLDKILSAYRRKMGG